MPDSIGDLRLFYWLSKLAGEDLTTQARRWCFDRSGLKRDGCSWFCGQLPALAASSLTKQAESSEKENETRLQLANGSEANRASLITVKKVMMQKFKLYRRGSNGRFYIEDNTPGKQESLGTSDKAETLRLLMAKNEADQQPAFNAQIAKTYLAADDPALAKRTWKEVMDASIAARAERRESTRDRHDQAFREPVLARFAARQLLPWSALRGNSRRGRRNILGHHEIVIIQQGRQRLPRGDSFPTN